MNKCEKCDSIFDTRQHLLQHQNRKNKCYVVTSYQCTNCSRYFKQSIKNIFYAKNTFYI